MRIRHAELGPRNPERSRGFSLMELMVVIVVIGLLAGVVAFNVVGVLERGRVATARTELKAIGGALQWYALDHHRLPEDLDTLLDESEETGEPYLRSLHADPWGTPYRYDRETGKHYKLCSWGADQREGGTGYDADIYEPPPRERRS